MTVDPRDPMVYVSTGEAYGGMTAKCNSNAKLVVVNTLRRNAQEWVSCFDIVPAYKGDMVVFVDANKMTWGTWQSETITNGKAVCFRPYPRRRPFVPTISPMLLGQRTDPDPVYPAEASGQYIDTANVEETVSMSPADFASFLDTYPRSAIYYTATAARGWLKANTNVKEEDIVATSRAVVEPPSPTNGIPNIPYNSGDLLTLNCYRSAQIIGPVYKEYDCSAEISAWEDKGQTDPGGNAHTYSYTLSGQIVGDLTDDPASYKYAGTCMGMFVPYWIPCPNGVTRIVLTIPIVASGYYAAPDGGGVLKIYNAKYIVDAVEPGDFELAEIDTPDPIVAPKPDESVVPYMLELEIDPAIWRGTCAGWVSDNIPQDFRDEYGTGYGGILFQTEVDDFNKGGTFTIGAITVGLYDQWDNDISAPNKQP